MDDIEENIKLKSSHRHGKKESRRKNYAKNKLFNKNKNIFYCILFLLAFILIIIIVIYIFQKILSNERNIYDKKILTLNEEKDIMETRNQIIKKEFKEFKEQIKTNNKTKIVAISYGNDAFKRQLEFNRKSALEIAKVDEYYGYGPEDIDREFKEKNSYILSKGRGNGYWLWKPYFIVKTFKKHLKDGDYLIYSDAGTFYTERAQLLVDFLNKRKVEMYLHRLPHLEKKYTKRDAFILMGVDLPFFSETGQFNAAFQIYRKSKFTEIFLDEYLYYAQDKRIITDDANTLGLPNYDGFIDHRHDQSILSLLTKKYSQVNANKMNIDVNIVKNYTELMPTIFYHYRGGGSDKYEELKKAALEANKDINKRASFN
jgi:hypothetical protein